MKFITKYRKFFSVAAACCWVFVLGLCLTGCAGLATWIADANQIIPIAASMAAAILQLIAGLGGTTISAEAMTTLDTVVKNLEGGLAAVQQMVQEYQNNPSPTLLASIEEGTKAVVDNLTAFLTNTGITDSATQSKVVAIVQLILTEITSFQSLLPVFKATAGDRVTVVIPMTTKEAKAAFDAILNTPSGNPEVDAALAKLKRL